MLLSCGDEGGVFLWSGTRNSCKHTPGGAAAGGGGSVGGCGLQSEDLRFHDDFNKQLTATK